MTTKLVAIYARVSTEEQTKGLILSTATQVQRCKEKALALGLPVASPDSGMIVEERHSGADLRWEGTKFMGLVERAQRHEFTDLICLSIDRFCRGGAAAFGAQASLFSDARVTVHYVLMDFGTDNPYSLPMQGFYAAAAQAQRDAAREASIRNRTEWARQGNITAGNTPPFGFAYVYDPVLRVKHKNHPLIIGYVPDPVNGPALLHMTEHVASGGSVHALKAWLEAQCIPTPKGAIVWHTASIRRILHNPTNYGDRRSFMTRAVERPNATHRRKDLKTKHFHEATQPDEQYAVTDERVTPIPGLTRDLWARAITRLAENKAFSARHATAPDEQRAERGLLFGGPIRCAVCGNGLRLKRVHGAVNVYYCPHTGTTDEGTSPMQMATRKLDACVWGLALDALRDPSFFERIVAETDAANGPAVRAASLRRQLSDAEHAHDKLLSQLERLAVDDELVADYQDRMRRNHATRTELVTALAATEQSVAAEEARRATLTAFSQFAAREADTLDAKTPIERRRILLALRTRVRMEHGDGLGRVAIRFDIRGLPGAAAGFAPSPLTDEDFTVIPDTWEEGIDLTNVPSAEIIADYQVDSVLEERLPR